ncbi:hypothetical protein MAHJHV51_50410 [Mycobacterium avium subsp. hominissuis]
MVEEKTSEARIALDTANFTIYKYVNKSLLPIAEISEISGTPTK